VIKDVIGFGSVKDLTDLDYKTAMFQPSKTPSGREEEQPFEFE